MIAKYQQFEDRQLDISIEIDPLGDRQQYKYQPKQESQDFGSPWDADTELVRVQLLVCSNLLQRLTVFPEIQIEFAFERSQPVFSTQPFHSLGGRLDSNLECNAAHDVAFVHATKP